MTKEEIEKQMWINYDEGYKAGCSETINKACEWLEQRQLVDLEVPNIEKFINDFRKYIEEQQ